MIGIPIIDNKSGICYTVSMEIEIVCRSQDKAELIENAASFYAKQLNLGKSRFKLTIRSLHNLGKNRGSKGEVFQYDDRAIYMVLDSRLSWTQMLLTLAHEMVHVKQIARGQYTGKIARNGKLLSCWCGKAVRAKYENRPWEVEAFGRQVKLVEMLVEHVAKKSRKKG